MADTIITAVMTPSATETETETSFTCFPKLPTELRLNIFNMAIEAMGPRKVHITSKNGDLTNWRSTTAIPVFLHVCRESRKEALKIWKLEFGLGSMIYFNFDLDNLYFGPLIPDGEKDIYCGGESDFIARYKDEFEYFVWHANPTSRAKVQRLHLCGCLFRDPEFFYTPASFRGLQHLVEYWTESDIRYFRQQVDDSTMDSHVRGMENWWKRHFDILAEMDPPVSIPDIQLTYLETELW